MRTVANDIIENGGEWSAPAIEVMVPSQPAIIDNESFNVTRYTYRFVPVYDVTSLVLHICYYNLASSSSVGKVQSGTDVISTIQYFRGSAWGHANPEKSLGYMYTILKLLLMASETSLNLLAVTILMH